MARRVRWRIATQLNRLPGQCWADLVTWALGWRKEDPYLTWTERSPWSPVTGTCRLDLKATGACYCGKLRQPAKGGP